MIIGYMKIIWSFLRKVTIEKLLISYEANLNEVIIIYILLGPNKSNALWLYDDFGYNLEFFISLGLSFVWLYLPELMRIRNFVEMRNLVLMKWLEISNGNFMEIFEKLFLYVSKGFMSLVTFGLYWCIKISEFLFLINFGTGHMTGWPPQ